MTEFDIGDRVTLAATFTAPGATGHVQPTTVTCTVRSPSGTEQLLGVTNTNATYSAEFEPDEAGTWWYRFAGTGSYVVAEESAFSVRKRRVLT